VDVFFFSVQKEEDEVSSQFYPHVRADKKKLKTADGMKAFRQHLSL
jgi:hypothetical protein